MGLSRTICEINGDVSHALNAHTEGLALGFCNQHAGQKNKYDASEMIQKCTEDLMYGLPGGGECVILLQHQCVCGANDITWQCLR